MSTATAQHEVHYMRPSQSCGTINTSTRNRRRSLGLFALPATSQDGRVQAGHGPRRSDGHKKHWDSIFSGCILQAF
jgi:hypothetical protein